MTAPMARPAPQMVRSLAVDGLDALLQALRRRGYRLVGPTLRDGAIVYDEIASARDLPAGWTDVQNGGTYRVERRNDQALFGYAVGPHSWKRFLFPAATRLWRARRVPHGRADQLVPVRLQRREQGAEAVAVEDDAHAWPFANMSRS